MVNPEAGKALSLISGIDLCKRPGDDFWQNVLTRVTLDLDERGDVEAVTMIRGLLSDLWEELPDAPTIDPQVASG